MPGLQPSISLVFGIALVAATAGCDRGTNTPAVGGGVGITDAESGRAKAPAPRDEDIESLYAGLNGTWSDDSNCASGSGNLIHVSAEGLDFGHSHFHVDSADLQGSELRLHGHSITDQGVSAGSLSVALIGRNPVQRLQIFSKTYYRCP